MVVVVVVTKASVEDEGILARLVTVVAVGRLKYAGTGGTELGSD